MVKIPFIVSARAGKLFGRENFSNPEGAIIELVKNSYDADATNCFVVFDIKLIQSEGKNGVISVIPSKEESQIFIIDNGEGMTESVIESQWMKIGTGNKDTEYLSDNKRIKTGAKGIGRFALDRLGYTAEMWTISKTAVDKVGFKWKMDWNQFDNTDKPINEITADLNSEHVNLKELINQSFNDNRQINNLIENVRLENGTLLKISNLKDEWFDKDILDVFKSLEALIPPKELNILFEVNLQHLQQPKEYGRVETAFFNDFDYKLTAYYNADKLSVDFEIIRNELDIKLVKNNFSDLYKNSKYPYDLNTLENRVYKYSKQINQLLKWDLNDKNTQQLKEVGSFNLTFYYLKFNVSKKEDYPFRSINNNERKSILNKFGGVKIYRDSFRVRPYGDPNNDWLKLGTRVAQSPAGAGQRIGDWRVRPEQTAGIITISRKANPKLIDKSDRGALQENETFDIFKNIIISVIHEFEYDRTKILNPYYKYFLIQKEKVKEIEIQTRAEKLANTIIAERKKVEEEVFGTSTINLFQEKKEDEERRKYEQAFKDTFKAIDDEKIENQNEEIVQVRALASLGLIVSSFAHELKEIRNNATEIKSLEKNYKSLIPNDLKNSVDYKDGIDILELLNEDSKKIKHWIDYSLTAIRKDKRKRSKFEFAPYFKNLHKTWEKILKSKDIHLHIDDKILKLDYDFRAFEMDMSTIFTNLINNSIDSFNSLTEIQNRNIDISFNIIENNIEIYYSDNGVGLSDVFTDKEEIFLPFTTTKKDRKGNEIGTGLGMYLVKTVIDDNNGDIQILESTKGFSVKITLPIRNN